MTLDELFQRIEQAPVDPGEAVVWVKLSPFDWQGVMKERLDPRLELVMDADSLHAGVVALLVGKGIWIQVSRSVPQGSPEFSTVLGALR